MQESLAFFEREKVAEIKKLQADLSTSEELAKHKRWAYDEHMLCQQKVHVLMDTFGFHFKVGLTKFTSEDYFNSAFK